MSLISSIPKSYQKGFTELSEIKESDFKIIAGVLEKAPPFASTETLVNNISEINGLEKVNIAQIFQSVGSLVSYFDKEEIISDIVKDITEIALDTKLIELKNKDAFAGRLHFLVTNPSLFYAAKAEDLKEGYGNVFITCRIISDIRPVFNVNVEEDPTAAVIIHNLHIHYQSNEEPYHKDITLVLNSNDIEELKQALQRAEKKENGLQTILKKAGVYNIKN